MGKLFDIGLSLEDAKNKLEYQTYFDYLNGRVMKVDLSGDSFDERLYDRDNDLGSAQKVIDSLRKIIK